MTRTVLLSSRRRASSTRRRWPLLGVAVAVVVAVVLLVIFDPPWVVESLSKSTAGSSVASSSNLDPDSYVAAVWKSKVLPTVKKRAVDLPTLLGDLKKDRAAASKKYGNYSVLDSPPAFLVKGSGRVVSVDTLSLVSKAGVALGSGTKPDVFIQIGPILSGTDVRDALPFINFNDFENQVKYGEVAIALNSKVRESALANLDTGKLKGKKVTFTGAFALSSEKRPLVTPITLKVAK
jgi:predicted lipoprotein